MNIRTTLVLLIGTTSAGWCQEQEVGNKPDPGYFKAFVQPVFREICSSCHGQSGNPANGRFPMQQSFGSPYTEEQTQKNFEEAVRRIKFKDPAGSLLILKPTAKVGHGGGRQIQEGGKEVKAFTDWINGAIHKGPAPGSAPAGSLDLRFFEQNVQPVLDKNCAIPACHGGTIGAGAVFHIERSMGGKFTPEVTKKNFEEAVVRVIAKDPARSKLARKPLGELTNGGGVRLEKESPEYKAIVDWINGGGTGGGGELDRPFFEQYVNPILARNCALPACHGGTEGIGARFHLFPPTPDGRFIAEQVMANMVAVTNRTNPRAKPRDPNSLILLKPTMTVSHGGGLRLQRNSAEIQTFVRWISGEKARPNQPPIVAAAGGLDVIEQAVGSPVTIDVSDTRDPNNDRVTFEYKVVKAPRGAMGEVNGNGPRASLTADRPGAYVISVIANDGKPGGESVPARITVILTGEAGTDDPAAIGSRTIPPASTDLSADRKALFVRRVYFDILARGPTSQELATAASMPANKLVRSLFNRPEFHRNWLETQFEHFGLNGASRFADDVVSDAVLGLFNREFSHIGLLYSLVTSKSYIEANFGQANPQNYLSVAFEHLLGRPPNEEEIRAAVDGEAIKSAISSGEFFVRYVQRVYKRYVGTDCPNDLAQKLAVRLAQYPAAASAIEEEIVLSEEYLKATSRPKMKTPAMLAQSLLRDLLGRAPNESEFNAAREGFAASQDRSSVALLVARSILSSTTGSVTDKSTITNRNDWVRSQFLRFLRRDPTESELAVFSDSLNDAQITPQLVIEAIVSSQEYVIY